MSKPERGGLVVLTVGGTLGLLLGGGPAGLLVATVCLVVGLVLFVASEASGMGTAPGAGLTSHPGYKKTRILVLVKEVHARPQRGGKFQEIRDPNEAGLELEVFIRCWLLNETDVAVQIVGELQLALKTSDGSIRVGQRISCDLENWRLSNLVKDEWDADIVRAVHEQILEVTTTEPLECGLPREGWLHFRFRNVSPSEFKTVPMELSFKDSFSFTHVGVASGPRHLPGRVRPFVSSSGSPGVLGEKPIRTAG
jgi:hypothetical protein